MKQKRTAKELAKDLIKKYGNCVIGNPNWRLKNEE